MEDTPPKVYEKVQEMFNQRTPEERLRMGCSMYDFSKELITQSILRDNPSISKKDLKKEIFLAFYKDDFTELQKERILKHIDSLEE